MKFNYSCLWQIKTPDDELHRWLVQTFLCLAQYFDAKVGLFFDLTYPISFYEAIEILSARMDLMPISINSFRPHAFSAPMLAQNKQNQKPALLIPHSPGHYVIYNGHAGGQIIDNKHLSKYFDEFILIIPKNNAISVHHAIKASRAFVSIWAMLLWAIITFIFIAIFFTASFMLLSELSQDNLIVSLTLVSLVLIGCVLIVREQNYLISKNYYLSWLGLVDYYYHRLFSLPLTYFYGLPIAEVMQLYADIKWSIKKYFNDYYLILLAILILAIGGCLLLFLWPTLGLIYVLLVLILLAIAWWIHRQKQPMLELLHNQREELNVQLERYRLAINAFNVKEVFNSFIYQLWQKQHQLIFIARRVFFLNFVQKKAYFFVPILSFVVVILWLNLNREVTLIWHKSFCLGLSLIVGYALVFICNQIIDAKSNNNIEKTLNRWPDIIAKTHVKPINIRGNIELFNVSFSYEENSALVLKNLSLKIDAEQFHLIYGPSGAGKSTLQKVLIGMLIPQRGQVVIDGQDLRSLDQQALRQYFGVILDDANLFAGTVLENILCGRNLSNRAIEHLLLSHEIFDYLIDMPMGLNTYVFWHLKNLSGFERLIILLARSLIHKPKILFMDEALNELSQEHQNIILNYLSQLEITRVITSNNKLLTVNPDQIITI